MRETGLVLLLISTLASPALGENWPQWRGPNQTGTSLEKDLPLRWSHTENVEWKIEMPDRSGATPIIWGDYIFLNVAEGESLHLWCVDSSSGTKLWTRWLSDGNYFKQKHNMSSPSPVTDGRHVWVLTGTGVLRAFDFQGRELWHRDIQKEYGAFGLNHGYGSSPLLHQGRIYVQVLHGMTTDEPSYLMAIDSLTGKNLWRVERPTDAIMESPDSYTTPAVLESADGPQIVISGGDYVTGHDPDTGREIWRVSGLNPTRGKWFRIIASPLVHKDMIYVSSRINPFLALRARGPESIETVWSTDQGPDVPSPVHDGKHLYIVRDKGIMWCLDGQSGKVVWGPERLRPGTYSSSPVLADNRIYVTNEDGVTSVVEASDRFRTVAVNELEGYTLSSPAISEGQIFIRTAEFLYCIGKRRASD